MAITYVGGKAQAITSTGNTTVSLTDLTGGSNSRPSAGDVLVITYQTGGNTAKTLTAGLAAVADTQYANAPTNDSNLRVFAQRLTDGSLFSVIVGGMGITGDSGVVIAQVFRGASDVISIMSQASAINYGRPNPPAVTPTVAGSWIVTCSGNACTSANRNDYLNSGDMTNWLSWSSNSATRSCTAGMAVKQDWVSGSFDPAAPAFGGSTSTNDSWISWTLVLEPDTTPPVITSSSSYTVAEASPNGRTLTANEPVTWSITGGADAARAYINTDSIIFDSPAFSPPQDANGDNVFEIQVTATDPAGNTANQLMLFTVTPLTITTSTSQSAPENTITSTALTVERGSATWSLVGGDMAQFTRSGSTLYFQAQDFERPVDGNSDNIYEIIVRATSGDGTVTKDATIYFTVTNVASEDNIKFIQFRDVSTTRQSLNQDVGSNLNTTLNWDTAWPNRRIGDCAMMIIKTPNMELAVPPSGFTLLGSTAGQGTADTSASNRLFLYYRFITGTESGTVNISCSGTGGGTMRWRTRLWEGITSLTDFSTTTVTSAETQVPPNSIAAQPVGSRWFFFYTPSGSAGTNASYPTASFLEAPLTVEDFYLGNGVTNYSQNFSQNAGGQPSNFVSNTALPYDTIQFTALSAPPSIDADTGGALQTVTVTPMSGGAVGVISPNTGGPLQTITITSLSGGATGIRSPNTGGALQQVTVTPLSGGAVGVRSPNTGGPLQQVTVTPLSGGAVGVRSPNTGGALQTITVTPLAATVTNGSNISRPLNTVTVTPMGGGAIGTVVINASTGGALQQVTVTPLAGTATNSSNISRPLNTVTVTPLAATVTNSSNISRALNTVTVTPIAATVAGNAGAGSALNTVTVTPLAATATNSSNISRPLNTVTVTPMAASASGAANTGSTLSSVALDILTGDATGKKGLQLISDISTGTWTSSSGGGLYEAIDEVTADDADYIQTATLGTVVMGFDSVGAPGTNEGIVLRYRVASDNGNRSLRVALKQGNTSIAEQTITNIPNTETDYVFNIPPANAANISNYSDLRLELEYIGSS
jgi:hypothetical protein